MFNHLPLGALKRLELCLQLCNLFAPVLCSRNRASKESELFFATEERWIDRVIKNILICYGTVQLMI